jgi:hypothetical protein
MSSNSVARLTKAHTLPDKIRYATLLACKSKSRQPMPAVKTLLKTGKICPRPTAGRRINALSEEQTMHENIQPIDRHSLLAEANRIIREHDDFIQGIEATDVTERNGVLVFSGEYFLDEQGLPTPKSTAVFNMFKHLAHVLSEKYTLAD